MNKRARETTSPIRKLLCLILIAMVIGFLVAPQISKLIPEREIEVITSYEDRVSDITFDSVLSFTGDFVLTGSMTIGDELILSDATLSKLASTICNSCVHKPSYEEGD